MSNGGCQIHPSKLINYPALQGPQLVTLPVSSQQVESIWALSPPGLLHAAGWWFPRSQPAVSSRSLHLRVWSCLACRCCAVSSGHGAHQRCEAFSTGGALHLRPNVIASRVKAMCGKAGKATARVTGPIMCLGVEQVSEWPQLEWSTYVCNPVEGLVLRRATAGL